MYIADMFRTLARLNAFTKLQGSLIETENKLLTAIAMSEKRSMKTTMASKNDINKQVAFMDINTVEQFNDVYKKLYSIHEDLQEIKMMLREIR
jgi:hypothetical protein